MKNQGTAPPARIPGQPNRFVLFVRHSYPAASPAHLFSFLPQKATILLP
jgi:hypothetical protein